MNVFWSPWEERTVEGLGPVVRVEILAPIAFEVRELAARLGQTPEEVLNLALQFGLVMVRDQKQLEKPS
jgi:plasmid maintenance system antidote protein VapI